jgi:hypothetical protein
VARLPSLQTLQETVEEQCHLLASESGVQSTSGYQGIPRAEEKGLEGSARMGMRCAASTHYIAPYTDSPHNGLDRGSKAADGLSAPPEPWLLAGCPDGRTDSS